ncbi:MAG: phosphatase PAP2 family protein [Minisyncoccota bacterium]
MTHIIIFTANYLYLLPVVIFIVYAFVTKRRRDFILLSVLVLPISYLLGKFAGHLFYDPRPFVVSHTTPLFPHAPDNGFPSDHALLTGTLAALITTFSIPLGLLMWLLAFLIGASRVLAGVHHALDIIGSFIIAAGSTAVLWRFLKRFHAFRG